MKIWAWNYDPSTLFNTILTDWGSIINWAPYNWFLIIYIKNITDAKIWYLCHNEKANNNHSFLSPKLTKCMSTRSENEIICLIEYHEIYFNDTWLLCYEIVANIGWRCDRYTEMSNWHILSILNYCGSVKRWWSWSGMTLLPLSLSWFGSVWDFDCKVSRESELEK